MYAVSHCTSSVWLGILSVWNNEVSEIYNPHAVVHYTPSVWLCSLSALANIKF